VSIESRYPRLWEKLRYAVLDAPATADAALRRAAYSAEGLAEPLSGYVEMLRRHAYRVQDHDIERVLDAGYSEDQIFEVTVAAALGAGDARLRAGLSALNEALR
jgi:alkylhydroperoxidase family enzyme